MWTMAIELRGFDEGINIIIYIFFGFEVLNIITGPAADLVHLVHAQFPPAVSLQNLIDLCLHFLIHGCILSAAVQPFK